MPKLVWGESGKKLYETGIRQGVLYPQDISGDYPIGVAWNGLTAITESPSGAEASPLYANDIKYLNLLSVEELGLTIEAYSYPEEFGVCDGTRLMTPGVTIKQQKRKPFGLCYRTSIGNDVNGGEHGYKLHLIYGAIVAPSETGYSSVNDSPDALTYSWEASTTPVLATGFKPTASITIDSTKINPVKLAYLEDILYGTDVTPARLPLPNEVTSMLSFVATYSIEDLIVGISCEFRIQLLQPLISLSRYSILLDNEDLTGKLPVATEYRTLPITFESDRLSIAFYDERTYENEGVVPTVVTKLKFRALTETGSIGTLQIQN